MTMNSVLWKTSRKSSRPGNKSGRMKTAEKAALLNARDGAEIK